MPAGAATCIPLHISPLAALATRSGHDSSVMRSTRDGLALRLEGRHNRQCIIHWRRKGRIWTRQYFLSRIVYSTLNTGSAGSDQGRSAEPSSSHLVLLHLQLRHLQELDLLHQLDILIIQPTTRTRSSVITHAFTLVLPAIMAYLASSVALPAANSEVVVMIPADADRRMFPYRTSIFLPRPRSSGRTRLTHGLWWTFVGPGSAAYVAPEVIQAVEAIKAAKAALDGLMGVRRACFGIGSECKTPSAFSTLVRQITVHKCAYLTVFIR